MEAAWLAHSARILRFADMFAYPFAALSHIAQLAAVWRRSGVLPTAPQVAHATIMLLLVPALLLLAPVWFGRRREAVHAAMRMLGSFMLPAWVQRVDSGAPVSSVQQLVTLLSMAFFSLAAVLRAPLHAAVQAASFAVTVGLHGITTHLRLRVAVAALNLAVVIALERASRRRFALAWRVKAAAKRD
jgi:hypothetical protein